MDAAEAVMTAGLCAISAVDAAADGRWADAEMLLLESDDLAATAWGLLQLAAGLVVALADDPARACDSWRRELLDGTLLGP